MTKGTDPYHDAFGGFCLPSFASSALESGTSTPLPSLSTGPKASLATTHDSGALDLIKTALTQQAAITSPTAQPSSSSTALPVSATGRRKGKFIHDQPRLMTHHVSYPNDANGDEVELEYCVTSFPILAHKYVNQDDFIDRILHGSPVQDNSQSRIAYRGMIVTSQRAVEAYIAAGVRAQDQLRLQGKTSSSSPTQWNRVPFFAVGPATSSALRSVPLAPWLRPRVIMGGDATGTGDALARYVIRHFSTPSILEPNGPEAGTKPPPLLYLVGDKNANTIPDMLSHAPPPAGPVPFEELQVYETAPDPHFAEGCEVLQKTLPSVVSRPPSRRPSHGSMYSKSGSRRPSGGSIHSADRPASAPRSSNPSRKSSSEELRGKPASSSSSHHHLSHVPSVGTPLGVSTMTSTNSTEAHHPRLDTLSIPPPAGGSPLMMASPAGIEPEAINKIEEESVLKLLRSKAKNNGSDSAGSSGARQLIARPDWIVFFSPSGVNYALEEFRRRKWMPPAERDSNGKPDVASTASSEATSTTPTSVPGTETISANTTVTSHASTDGSQSNSGSSRKYPRIAVIGNTTRSWMVENLNIEPDAVASKPGPKELKDAIEAVELRSRSRT